MTRRDLLETVLAVAAVPGDRDALARPASPSDDQTAATWEIRTKKPRQIIDHFSASDCWSMDPIGRNWSVENRERVADLLFSREKGIGLSLWRFNVGAGGAVTDRATLWDPWRGAECFRMTEEEPYDWSRQSGQQWFLHAALKRGVDQFLAFANSPPVWMTKNGHAHADRTTGSTNLKLGYEGRFARFLVDVIEHFRAEAIPFTVVSPINEPNWDWLGGQEGCPYSNDDIVRVIRALHDEIERRKLRLEIDAPNAGDLGSLLDDDLYREATGATDPTARYNAGKNQTGLGKYRELLRDLLGPADLQSSLGGCISAHSYWTDSDPMLVAARRTVRRNIERHAPNGRYWMTEYCVMEHKRDLGMDTALRVARVIHHDLVDGEASAWHWWRAVSPADYKDGLIYTDYQSDGIQNILPSRILWVLGNYSRFIRPGARRVETRIDRARLISIEKEPSAPDPKTEPVVSAFVSCNRREVILVVIHEGKEEGSVRFRFDRTPRRLVPHVTSDTEALARLDTIDARETVRIPGRSVVTFVGTY